MAGWILAQDMGGIVKQLFALIVAVSWAHSIGCKNEHASKSASEKPILIQAAAFGPDDTLWIARLSEPPVIERWSLADSAEAPSRSLTLAGVKARIGAFDVRSDESLVVALAWVSARVPTQGIVRVSSDGTSEPPCIWQAPWSYRWQSQPRGASSVLTLPDRSVLVGGRDRTLIVFDASSCHGRPLGRHDYGSRELAIDVAATPDESGRPRISAAPLGVVRGPPWTLAPGGLGKPCKTDIDADATSLTLERPDGTSFEIDLASVLAKAGARLEGVVADPGCHRVAAILGTRVAVCEPVRGCRILGKGA